MAAAGFALKASHNLDECLRAVDGWTSAAVEVAAPRTLNEVIAQAQVAGLRVVARIYGLGPRTMEKYIDVRPANASKLIAEIQALGESFPLALFNPVQTKDGVRARIRGHTILFPHAFIRTLKRSRRVSGPDHKGHKGVFARGSYGGKGNVSPNGRRFGRFVFGRNRLSINEIFTFSAPTAFSNDEVTEAMQARVDEQFPKVFARNIRFAASGR